MLADKKSSCVTRMSRIAGQVRGMARAIAADQYRIDVDARLSAAWAAPVRVQSAIIKDQGRNFVSHAGILEGQVRPPRQVTQLAVALARTRH